MDFDIVARNTVTILSRRITDTVGLFVSFDRPIRSLENPNGPLGQELFDDPTTGHIERVVGQFANFNPTQVLLSGTILDPDRFVAKERDVVPGDAMLKGGQFSLGNDRNRRHFPHFFDQFAMQGGFLPCRDFKARKIPHPGPAFGFSATTEEYGRPPPHHNTGLPDPFQTLRRFTRRNLILPPVLKGRTKLLDRTRGTGWFPRATDFAAQLHQALIEATDLLLRQEFGGKFPQTFLGRLVCRIAPKRLESGQHASRIRLENRLPRIKGNR